MRRVLVFGAGGQLGKEFQYLTEEESWELEPIYRIKEQVSITDAHSVQQCMDTIRPDVVINCAAYTAVDQAEEQADLAETINTEAVGMIAQSCARHGIPFVHFSTDYVYHNEKRIPLRESDPTLPKGVYAQSKLAGEQLCLSTHPFSFVIRTSWVYGMFGHNFVRTMLRLSKEYPQIKVVADQIGTPTWARDIARAVLKMINEDRLQESAAGIYNFSNQGICSWYDFAVSIFELSRIEIPVIPIASEDYPTPAQRPRYSVLDKTKFQTQFEQSIPYWRRSLANCLEQML